MEQTHRPELELAHFRIHGSSQQFLARKLCWVTCKTKADTQAAPAASVQACSWETVGMARREVPQTSPDPASLVSLHLVSQERMAQPTLPVPAERQGRRLLSNYLCPNLLRPLKAENKTLNSTHPKLCDSGVLPGFRGTNEHSN